jgi:hypothetical protein
LELAVGNYFEMATAASVEHQQLLIGSLSVDAPDDELFLSYVSRHTSRKEAFDLAEFLDALPLKDHEKLCSLMHKRVAHIVDNELYKQSNR